MSHRFCTSWLPAVVLPASGICGIDTVVAARASADGTFQFEIATLDARPAVPAGITFDRP